MKTGVESNLLIIRSTVLFFGHQVILFEFGQPTLLRRVFSNNNNVFQCILFHVFEFGQKSSQEAPTLLGKAGE